MTLKMLQPSKGPLTVWTLESLFLLPRLSLRDLLSAGGGFHQRPIVSLSLAQGPIATGLVGDSRILEQSEHLDEVWRLQIVCHEVGSWDCGERNEARRRDGSHAGCWEEVGKPPITRVMCTHNPGFAHIDGRMKCKKLHGHFCA